MTTENENHPTGQNNPDRSNEHAAQNNHDSSNEAAAQNEPAEQSQLAGTYKPAEQSSSEQTREPGEPDKPPGIHKPAGDDKPAANYKILGGNLLVFALYTLTALSTGTDGGVAALCLAGIQFIICTILAIAYKRSVWFLSAVLVLIIGFGTCVSTFTLGDMR
jgi:hypothetical protein